ncbi:MAG: helix-hairpin-helix domain-containing protein [Bacteroidales bacterium]|jgi:competence ComEA-like helix-hairpin-helix protein|nr:helix-hairpin-helix domain-containing protein [Bacteroidales bacterium]
MQIFFLKINRYFAFTRKDRCGIYVLLFLIVATIALRTAFPFWKTEFGKAEIIETDLGNTVFEKTEQVRNTTSRNKVTYSDTNRAKYTPPAYMQKKAFIVALNQADTLDLKELRGIGSTYARRIVAYREKLGGFIRKEQLKEVWGIDSALYERIAPSITVNAANIRQININSADIDILKKHPYLDYYLAKEIVKYREKYGAFTTTDDLLKVNLMDKETFYRVKPYMTIAE